MSRSNFDRMVVKHKPFSDYKNTDLYLYTYSNLKARNYSGNIDFALSNYYCEQMGLITYNNSNASSNSNNPTYDAPVSNNTSNVPTIPIITPILSNVVVPIITPIIDILKPKK